MQSSVHADSLQVARAILWDELMVVSGALALLTHGWWQGG